MDKLYLKVNTEKQSEKFQEFLFSLGYEWSCSIDSKKVNHTDQRYLVINRGNNCIHYSDSIRLETDHAVFEIK